MSNIATPQRQIHYISELKKIFCGRNQQPVTQKFKIDTAISDDYYFQIVNKNNQLVSLLNRSFKIYGSYIDSKREIHILFFTESYAIEDNVLHFHLNTNTNEYAEYINTEYKEINLTIIETTAGGTQVVLRDVALAYRRPYIDQDTQIEIVSRNILTGVNVPLTGSFGVGTDISLIPGTNSFAFGEGLITVNQNQVVLGQYNVPDAEQALIVANGTTSGGYNLFTVNYDGEAYVGGNRILTVLDRTNVSELVNDIGYITVAQVPVYTGGDGISVSGQVISLTASIPSATSQLVNDSDYLVYVSSPDSSIDIRYFPPDGIQIKVASGFINNYALKTYVDDSISVASGVVTSWVNDQGYLTAHQDLSNYATKQWVEGKNYLVSSDLNDYATKTWVQNQGYLTAHQDLSNYALKSQIPTNNNQLTNGAGYITGYNAGSGISIENGTINCTVSGGGSISNLSAGPGLRITQIDDVTWISIATASITVDDQPIIFDKREISTTETSSVVVATYTGSAQQFNISYTGTLPDGVVATIIPSGVSFTATEANMDQNTTMTAQVTFDAADISSPVTVPVQIKTIGYTGGTSFNVSSAAFDFSANDPSTTSTLTWTYDGVGLDVQTSGTLPAGVTSSLNLGNSTLSFTGVGDNFEANGTTSIEVSFDAIDIIPTTVPVDITIADVAGPPTENLIWYMDFSNGLVQPKSNITGVNNGPSCYSIETDPIMGTYLSCNNSYVDTASTFVVYWPGSQQYLANLLSGTDPFTISFWMKSDNYFGDCSIVSWRREFNYPGASFYNDGNFPSKINCRMGMNYWMVTSTSVDNSWKLWTMVRDSTGVTWYVDGIFDSFSDGKYFQYEYPDQCTPQLADVTADRDFAIGTDTDMARSVMDITKIRIYNRALSQAEILLIYDYKA